MNAPGFDFHELQGKPKRYSVHVNGPWCITFEWQEAQTLSGRSLALLRPTIRSEDSELWFSWNPRRKSDAVDRMFRGGSPPSKSVVVRANWSDNPRFTAVLEQERIDCLRDNPAQYHHIWEGGYAAVFEGAYFAEELSPARTGLRCAIALVAGGRPSLGEVF